MKGKTLKRLAAWMLSLALLFSLVPAAFAEEVNTTEDTVTVTLDRSSLSLTLEHLEDGEMPPTALLTATVTVNGTPVSNPVVTWSSDNDKVAAVESGGTAAIGTVTAVGGGTAAITATYTHELPDGTTKPYTATCSVEVKIIPVESVSIDENSEFVLLDPGHSKTLKFTVTPSNATDPSLTWKSEKPEIVTVDKNGKVTAVTPGTNVTITATSVSNSEKSDTQLVTVSGLSMEESLEMVSNQTKTLEVTKHGAAASYTITWTTSNPSVATVRDGDVITYYPGTTVITATAGSYKATCRLTVKEDMANAINADMKVGEVLFFSDLLSALENRADDKIDASLEYVTNLSVATSSGILHYGYLSPDTPGSGVGSTEKYYVSPGSSQRGISDLSFVPKADFGGTAIITYMGYGSGKTFNGTIRVDVENSGDVSYNTAEGRLLEFDVQDFASVCATKTGGNLRYVTFVPPSDTKGTLYYNYSSGQYSQKVASGTKYYMTGSSLLLEGVSFLPAEDFSGTVSIVYYATTSSNSTYKGTITISVFSEDGEDEEVGDIVYKTSGLSPVSFEASDFNDVCKDLLDSNLNYVYFDLPDSSDGTLYYDYTSSTDYDSLVSGNTRYFRNSRPRIDYVDFVPATGASGTVTISYTGYSASGEQFDGTVSIRLGSASSGVVNYNTSRNDPVDFDGLDFNEACLSANGESLGSISFDLPASSYGTLYYNYKNSSSTGTKVTESKTYSRSSLSKITFVPKSSFTGTVSIPFSGDDSTGEDFNGTVNITVDSGGSTGSPSTVYYRGSSLPIRFSGADIRNACSGILSGALSYIYFETLPSSNYGKLMVSYSGAGTGTLAEVDTRYYSTGIPSIDTLSFIPKAGFTGTAAVYYTAVDTLGNTASSNILIYISDSYLETSFTDLQYHSWAAPSIEYLRDAGVTYGYSDGTFAPGKSISRGQFVAMLCRLFAFENKYTTNFPDVAVGSYYYQDVMTAKALGIVTGDNGKFNPNNPITRQQAMTMVQRAMKAAGMDVAGASATLLEAYEDGNQVSSYAANAMASMIRMGVLYGDNGKLNPYQNITRAQMAVILHRVATLA